MDKITRQTRFAHLYLWPTATRFHCASTLRSSILFAPKFERGTKHWLPLLNKSWQRLPIEPFLTSWVPVTTNKPVQPIMAARHLWLQRNKFKGDSQGSAVCTNSLRMELNTIQTMQFSYRCQSSILRVSMTPYHLRMTEYFMQNVRY